VQKISKLKLAAVSILILVGISPYLFQRINAQPLNLTPQQNSAQQNLTQSLSPGDQFKCTKSPEQPTDPIEMNSNWRGLNDTWTIHTVKETFECASPVSSVPPPFERDLYITSGVLAKSIGTFRGALFRALACDTSLQGDVLSCSSGWKSDVNATARDCREDPIQHPMEMDTVVDPSNIFRHASIRSVTHEYECGQIGSPDKIKVVTIFDTVFGSPPLALTCIKDVASATVELCSVKFL
jgi:hypothetical protein